MDPVPRQAALRLENRATILTVIASVIALAAIGFLFGALMQAVATDDYKKRLTVGLILLGVALIPFAVAQVYSLRVHLLCIEDAIRKG